MYMYVRSNLKYLHYIVSLHTIKLHYKGVDLA